MSGNARRADVVFVGSVTDMAGHNLFEVRASDIYKGSPGAWLTVRTGPADPTVVIEDTVSLQVDQQYLFFLVRSRGQWLAQGCSGTEPVTSRLLTEADQVLGPATPLRVTATPDSGPSESPSATPDSGTGATAAPSPTDDGSRTWVWMGLGTALLVGAGAVAAATRRGRPRPLSADRS